MSSSNDGSSDEISDKEDAAFNVRTYLKRIADEYKEISDRYFDLTKQYEDIRAAARGRNITVFNRTLEDLEGEKNEKDECFAKLIKHAQNFLKDFPLKPQFDNLHELSCIWSYITIIRRTLDIGAKLQSAFQNDDWSMFVQFFSKDLNADLALRLSESSCTNLRTWIFEYVDAWRQYSLKHLAESIVNHLERANIPQDVLHADEQLTKEMGPLMEAFFRITSSNTIESEPFSKLTQVILRPFTKRFVHHFCGGKEDLDSSRLDQSQSTNTIKPEWYLSVIIKWHRQFSTWMERFTLENFADTSSNFQGDTNFGFTLASHFMRGLVELARQRFKFDVLKYAKLDPSYLPHLIDEGISFDTDMIALKYPEHEPRCIDILTEPGIFELWVQLEQAEATKCLEVFLSEPEAWMLRYGDNTDVEHVDSNKVPFVTDNVLLLLTAMKHRFRLVRTHEHRRIYVQIQSTILHDFRERLVERSRELRSPISSTIKIPKKEKSSPSFANLVNTCVYVCSILTEWQESPFYLAIRVACFDDVIDLFEHTRRNLLRDGCTAVLNDLTPTVDEYRRSFAFYTGRGDVSLSGQASAFLYTPLQEALSILSQTLNRKNFQAFARQLAVGLEKLLIDRVILELRLDHKSGEELQRQLGTALIRMGFENYGVLGAAVYFSRLSQYLHVVSMTAGNCSLLKEALKGKRSSAEHILNEMGIDKITLQEVENLLQRRSDLM